MNELVSLCQGFTAARRLVESAKSVAREGGICDDDDEDENEDTAVPIVRSPRIRINRPRVSLLKEPVDGAALNLRSTAITRAEEQRANIAT